MENVVGRTIEFAIEETAIMTRRSLLTTPCSLPALFLGGTARRRGLELDPKEEINHPRPVPKDWSRAVGVGKPIDWDSLTIDQLRSLAGLRRACDDLIPADSPPNPPLGGHLQPHGA
jgi:hypothetical protein